MPATQYTEYRLIVPSTAQGQRIDQFLVHWLATTADAPAALKALSRARAQRLLTAGQALLDGVAAKSSLRLQGGEQLLLRVAPAQPLQLLPEALALDVLYEDEHLIAVNKPADLVVHPGAGRQSGTLVNALLAHCRDLSGIGGVLRPGIVHRLDRGTSGVVVAAKHDNAHEGLAKQFAQRRVHKLYNAWVWGTPVPAAGQINTLYGRHPMHRKKFSGRVQRGKPAVTHYSIEHSAYGISKLSVRLETGRTHQIRVHLGERGHPLLGDALYGGASSGTMRALPGVSRTALQALLARRHGHALHALRLALQHPITAAPLILNAPLPAELLALEDFMRQTSHFV